MSRTTMISVAVYRCSTKQNYIYAHPYDSSGETRHWHYWPIGLAECYYCWSRQFLADDWATLRQSYKGFFSCLIIHVICVNRQKFQLSLVLLAMWYYYSDVDRTSLTECCWSVVTVHWLLSNLLATFSRFMSKFSCLQCCVWQCQNAWLGKIVTHIAFITLALIAFCISHTRYFGILLWPLYCIGFANLYTKASNLTNDLSLHQHSILNNNHMITFINAVRLSLMVTLLSLTSIKLLAQFLWTCLWHLFTENKI